MRPISDRKWNQLVLSSARVFFFTLFGFLLAMASSDTCPRPPADVAYFGCVEAVLYRYQTLIAAGIALLVAIWAASPVFRQVREMQSQSAIQAYIMFEGQAAAIREVRLIAEEIVRTASLALVFENFIKDRQPLRVGRIVVVNNNIKEFMIKMEKLEAELDKSSKRRRSGIAARAFSTDVVIMSIALRAKLADTSLKLHDWQEVFVCNASDSHWTVDEDHLKEISAEREVDQLKTAAHKLIAELDREIEQFTPLLDQSSRIAAADS